MFNDRRWYKDVISRQKVRISLNREVVPVCGDSREAATSRGLKIKLFLREIIMLLLHRTLYQQPKSLYQQICSDIFARYGAGAVAGTQDGESILGKKRNSFVFVPAPPFAPVLSNLQAQYFLTALLSVS